MLAQKAWRMIRTLIFTYLVSGVLLTALAFALYKFRLPESQITLGISGVYILPFSVVVLGKFRRFLLVIFLSLFLHLDFSFIYSKFSMPFWGFFY